MTGEIPHKPEQTAGRTIFHLVIGTLIASLVTSVGVALGMSAIHAIEDTSGGPMDIIGVALIVSFVFLPLPAAAMLVALAVLGARAWWAYAAGGIVMALLTNVIFIGEMNPRLLALSSGAGIFGGLAAWYYLKNATRLLEAHDA